MDIRKNRRIRFHFAGAAIIALGTLFLSGCSYFLLQDIFIPMNFVAADSTVTDSSYSIDGRTWVWQSDGVKIEVEQLTDPMLNALFPEISNKGEFSTNPYTYGNWMDMEKGYTPAKFTVFNIRVFNYTQPKVELDPRKIELRLDNGGVLKSYGLDQYDDPPNMERYLIANQGSSGNERRRFKDKIGKAKQTMFILDPVFKGKTTEGLIVFDPLPPEIKTLDVVLRDVVLKYDANDWPFDVRTLVIPFKRGGDVAATVLEIQTKLDSTNSTESANAGSESDTYNSGVMTHDLEIRNVNAYNNLLEIVRSDDRYKKAVLDVIISATGTVSLDGFLASTGDQKLDDKLKSAVEELTFSPVRTVGTQGFYIPVSVRFQLRFGLSPMLPQVKISPGKVEVVPAIGTPLLETETK